MSKNITHALKNLARKRIKDMDYASTLALLKAKKQEHLLDYYNELTDEQKSVLLSQIEKTDFSVLDSIKDRAEKKTGKLSPADTLDIESVAKSKAQYEKIGLQAVKDGKVAAVLLAGGQGSRLGFDAPKGMYNIGVTRELSIFGCQMENIKAVAKNAGYNFHLFVMTSDINDKQTRDFFAEKNYFGYEKKKIHFFVQDLTPACSFDGKVLLSQKHLPALVPNGNGGWYVSLLKNGFGELIKKEGIEWLNLYGVDNVLQKICDPVFVGATLSFGVNCSSKVVSKTRPEEKVGVLCKEDGVPTVIEYTEIGENKYERNADGKLTFRAGVILNYLFSVRKLDEICNSKLPYHIAEKKVACIKGGQVYSPDKPNAYKFELLAVDLVKLMGNCLAFEVEREKEFAPVKNATGVDSVETARELLKLNGIRL